MSDQGLSQCHFFRCIIWSLIWSPILLKIAEIAEQQIKTIDSKLGKRWLSHRGLKTEQWERFMLWFVYFYNQEKLSHSKTKKA